MSNRVEGKVEMVVFRGSSIEYRIKTPLEDELIVFVPNIGPSMKVFNIGEKVFLGWTSEAGVVLPYDEAPTERT
jgi:hypothetical protein